MSATASGVFGPAPPETNLDETQNASITSAVVSLMAIGTVAVAIRAIARTIQKGITLAADDYCVMVGLVGLKKHRHHVRTLLTSIDFRSWNGYLQSRQSSVWWGEAPLGLIC